MENSVFSCVEKCCIFVGRPVLDSGRDSSGRWTVDSGRDNGTARDAGQWTVDSGQWTVDSGQWTVDKWTSGQVDGTEWTEALSLLWFTKSNSCLFLVDRRSPIISRGYKLSVQPCRVLPIKTAGYANGWTEPRETHIYIFI